MRPNTTGQIMSATTLQKPSSRSRTRIGPLACDGVSWATVIGLFDSGRPFAVIGGVVAVYVDTLNRVLRAWLFAHVCQEVLKGSKPSVTDSDATSAVMRVATLAMISATATHRVVSAVLGRLGGAVCGGPAPSSDDSAAACLRRSVREARRYRFGEGATVALASPSRTASPSLRVSNDHKKAEPLPDWDWCWHKQGKA